MKILIIGAGRVGSELVDVLSYEDAEILVIDRDSGNLPSLKKSNVSYINKDILDGDILNEIDFSSFEYVLAVTDKDRTNILIASLTKNLSTKTIIRLNIVDSLDEIEYLKKSLNIYEIVNPEYEVGKFIKNIIGNSSYYTADYFGKGKIEVAGHLVDTDGEFDNIALKDIGSLATILVVAILRDGKFFTPNGQTILQKGDYLYLMGLSKDISNFKMEHFLIKSTRKSRDVTIIGGNLITNKMISEIEDINLKIIEEDSKIVRLFRDKIPKAFVVNRPYRDENLLNEENIREDSIFISMTDNDELNIVLGLMAKSLRIERTIISLNTNIYSKILDPLNMYSHVEPFTVMANEIVNKVSQGSKISVNFMFAGKAQVFEISTSEKFPHINKKIKEMNIPKGIIIGGIIRSDGLAIIPRGETIIEKDDKLVVFCTDDKKEELKNFIDTKKKNYLSSLFK